MADSALKDTVFEGWEIKGPFAPFIDEGLKKANSFIKDKNAFYDAADESFDDKFQHRYGATSLRKPAGVYSIAFAEDPQGQEGPIKFFMRSAKAFGVDLAIVGPDLTGTGSKFETNVVDALRSSSKKFKLPVYVTLGPHDTEETAELVKKRGLPLADGKVHKFGEASIFGANSLNVIPSPGRASRLINKNTTEGAAKKNLTQNLIDIACSSPRPLIITLHEKSIGIPVAQANCASAVLTGHDFNPGPPVDHGKTVEFVSGSIGGHGPSDGLEIYSIISNPASYYIINFDKKTDQVIDYTKVTLYPKPFPRVEIGETIKRGQITDNQLEAIKK